MVVLDSGEEVLKVVEVGGVENGLELDFLVVGIVGFGSEGGESVDLLGLVESVGGLIEKEDVSLWLLEYVEFMVSNLCKFEVIGILVVEEFEFDVEIFLLVSSIFGILMIEVSEVV